MAGSSFSERFEKVFRNALPSPFALVVLLTFAVFAAALMRILRSGTSAVDGFLEVSRMWYQGIWDSAMLVFALQMMLILVLGHALALSRFATTITTRVANMCHSTPKAALVMALLSVCTGLLNWGLALIFGAVLARKIAENAALKGFKINYPLVAASAYTGMMVWHAGLSGSATLKVAEPGHLKALNAGSSGIDTAALPEWVGFGDTVFSPMNIFTICALLIAVPLAAWLLGRYRNASSEELPTRPLSQKGAYGSVKSSYFMERIDHSRYATIIIGLLVLFGALSHSLFAMGQGHGQFIDPNYVNMILLGAGLLAHRSLSRFVAACEEAMPGAAAILIQFPLYFGIMGIMKNAGLVQAISLAMTDISNVSSFPLLTFLSAGFVNILVPSGGGQWMVQGPIIIESAIRLQVPLGKGIMAMAYGDQITNMIQPFWAMPLLAITGLKAQEILPYTLCFMMVGIAVYVCALLLY